MEPHTNEMAEQRTTLLEKPSRSAETGENMSNGKKNTTRPSSAFQKKRIEYARLKNSKRLLNRDVVKTVTDAINSDEELDDVTFRHFLNQVQEFYGYSESDISDLTGIGFGILRNWKNGISSPAHFRRKSVLKTLVDNKGKNSLNLIIT